MRSCHPCLPVFTPSRASGEVDPPAMELVGTQQQGPPGRKRLPNRDRPTAEDDALNQIAREAEARLAAKRAARAEAREIRMKELERQQKEASDEDEHMSVGSRGSLRVEEKPEKDFEKGIRTVSSLSAATLASLGGTTSRRGSGDTSISVDTEASIREIKDISELRDQIQDVEGKYMQGLKEIKDSLAETEEKYKKAMVSNAQLDNEKTNFMYQVDALKDALLELEEQLAESKRQYDEKNKDFEREKHAHAILQFQFLEVKEALKHREELLTEIRQLQQKQEGYVREITDLQETIEWKEKKIGALERQKEFFDSIRSERDDLREEVSVLKEQLKQHGIVLNSEVDTNGETSSVRDDGLSSKVIPGHAPKETGEGILGRANEVEMKSEILENVGKRELLQNTEHEEHSEETKEQEIVQECLEIKTLHADGNAEAEKITEGKVASTLILSSGLEEPAEGHAKHVSGVTCNSGVVELRRSEGEGEIWADTKEVEESVCEQSDHGNINEVNQNKVAVLDSETNQEINTGLENTSQQKNKEKQKDTSFNEAESSNEEVFQEASEVVNNCVAISNQLTLAEDTLTKVPSIDSNTEQPCNERENTGEIIAASDLKEQLIEDEGGIKITDKAQGAKNETDEIKEKNETENAVQRQKTEVVASAAEQRKTYSSEHIQDELVEEQKQVEVEENQFLPSKLDSLVEEKQNEQEIEESKNNPEKTLAKENDQKTALFGALDFSESEKNSEKDTLEEIPAEETVVDATSLTHKDVEDDSKKSREIKPEFTGDTPASTKKTHEEPTDDSHEEVVDDPTQAKDWPVGEEIVDKQEEIIQNLPKTSKMENVEVHKEGEEVKNNNTAEKEMLEVVPDIQEGACLTTQEAKFSDQEEKADSEEEEVSEEYHEAFDFDESSFGEQKTTETFDSQDRREEKSNKVQERAGIAESAGQNVIGDNEMVNDGAFIEGDENIQQEKIKESKEGKCPETDPSFFETPKPVNELSEDTNEKLLDQSVKDIAECSSEELKRLGSSVDDNDVEEVQVGRKGKGKSREDCVMS